MCSLQPSSSPLISQGTERPSEPGSATLRLPPQQVPKEEPAFSTRQLKSSLKKTCPLRPKHWLPAPLSCGTSEVNCVTRRQGLLTSLRWLACGLGRTFWQLSRCHDHRGEMRAEASQSPQQRLQPPPFPPQRHSLRGLPLTLLTHTALHLIHCTQLHKTHPTPPVATSWDNVNPRDGSLAASNP